MRVRVIGRGRQQLDHRAEGAVRAQDRALSALRALPGGRHFVDGARVHCENLGDVFRIARKLVHKHGTLHDRARERLRNLALASARNRARLVAKRAVRPRAYQTPSVAAALLFESDAISRGKDVFVLCPKRQFMAYAFVFPSHISAADAEFRAVRQIVDVGEPLIDGVASGFTSTRSPSRAMDSRKSASFKSPSGRPGIHSRAHRKDRQWHRRHVLLPRCRKIGAKLIWVFTSFLQ